MSSEHAIVVEYNNTLDRLVSEMLKARELKANYYCKTRSSKEQYPDEWTETIVKGNVTYTFSLKLGKEGD